MAMAITAHVHCLYRVLVCCVSDYIIDEYRLLLRLVYLYVCTYVCVNVCLWMVGGSSGRRRIIIRKCSGVQYSEV